MKNETIITIDQTRKLMEYYNLCNHQYPEKQDQRIILFDGVDFKFAESDENKRIEYLGDTIRIWDRASLIRFFYDAELLKNGFAEIPQEIWHKQITMHDETIVIFYTKTKYLTVINE